MEENWSARVRVVAPQDMARRIAKDEPAPFLALMAPEGVSERMVKTLLWANWAAYSLACASTGYVIFALLNRKAWRKALDEQLTKGMAKGYAVAVDHHRKGFHLLPTTPHLRLVKVDDPDERQA